ncbi:DUF4385 domain-containing protein [Mucilaginibacter sp. UR6-1]|uniref:DUF4385 family protein n=1 Tax=Mucilaginibacter sp. UR6-1 TaxID=1435643 RepID=UPI001E5574D7|nr:DUF4385 family protein [Mucilaginibacter sp. UR6-1]MCC8408253.1 DUF4385 domain-containing protein [Mucilaginibacter sp. UR6-1]
MKADTPSYLNFDTGKYAWKPDIDYKKYPELYRVGKGEQGVLICEPYKSEIGSNWRFKTEKIAKESSAKINAQFQNYLNQGDFVGADMARKYLQIENVGKSISNRKVELHRYISSAYEGILFTIENAAKENDLIIKFGQLSIENSG